MDIERSEYFKVLMIRNRIRNGLFLLTLRNFVTRFGLDIYPYYWDKEEFTLSTEPKIKDNLASYNLVDVTTDEIGILNKVLGKRPGALEKEIQEGHLCMGLKSKGEIVAVVFAKCEDFIYRKRIFKLNDDQAYIYNLYTFEAHRGKNLAPYLRYHCYKRLVEKGINEIYCITAFFNKSSLRSNKKLCIRHKILFLYVGLFKRKYWNFILKHFEAK